jgi:chromosome segregation ATPase
MKSIIDDDAVHQCSYQQQLRDLEAQHIEIINNKDATIAELKTSVETLGTEVKEFDDECDKHVDDKKVLDMKITDLEGQFREFSDEQADEKAQSAIYRAKKEKLKKLKEQSADLESQCDEHEATITSLNSEVLEVCNENEDLETEVADLEERREKLTIEKEELETKVANLEVRCEEFMNELAGERAKKAELKQISEQLAVMSGRVGGFVDK